MQKMMPNATSRAIATLTQTIVQGASRNPAPTAAPADGPRRSAIEPASPQRAGLATTLAEGGGESLVSPSVGSCVLAGLVAGCLGVTTGDADTRTQADLPKAADEPEVVADADEEGTAAANDGDAVAELRCPGPGPRFKDQNLFANVISPRMVAARRLSGITQTDLARAIGYKTPAQLNQWEMGRRPVPLRIVIRLATVLSVSCDYLLGLTDDPEHDPALARRAALQRAVRSQLDEVVAALAITFERHSALQTPVATSELVRAAEQVISAMNAFVAANEEAVLDLPRGAPVLHAMRQLAEVTASANDRMQRHQAFEQQLHTVLKQARFG